MRIAVVCSGRGVHAVNRGTALREAGHEVVLITANRPSVPLNGLRSMFPPPVSTRPLLGWLGVVKQLRALRRLIDSVRADVVYVHYAGGPAAWLAWASGRRPLAVNVMGGDVLYNERGGLSRLAQWMTRRLVRKADLVTSKSAHLTERLLSLGVRPERIMPVRWGIDLRKFHRREDRALREQLRIAPDDRVILSPRILKPFYNIHLIVEAMPAVLRHVPNAKLLLLEYNADAEYRTQIERRVGELGLSNHVLFGGEVPPEQMPEIVSIADVSVGIPKSDGMPQSLLEAMACEVPAVIGRLDRYEELVRHGESAWFVDFDAPSVAEGIVTLLEDDGLRTRLTKRGRELVEREADLQAEVARVTQRLNAVQHTSRPRETLFRPGRWFRFLPVLLNELIAGYRKRLWQLFAGRCSKAIHTAGTDE